MGSSVPLPQGFSLIKKGRAELLIRDAYRDRLMDRGIHAPEFLLRQHANEVQCMRGRGVITSLPLDGKGSERMVIRHYEHGGIFRALTKDLFLLGSRPFQELVITEMVRKAGLPTTEILVAIKRWAFWPFYRGDLVSKEIPNSVDFIQYLSQWRKGTNRKRLGERRELIRQAGRLVREMHEVGICHADLHLKNFIVKMEEEGKAVLHIIDFDRSRVIHPLTSNKWFANLMRLDRSVEKWRLKGLSITPTDRVRFLTSYLQGDKGRKALAKKLLKKYLPRRRRYRVGWALERLLYG